MAKPDGPQFNKPLKADAVKFTPVKEGQKYPMGKHGQYKLFHEHQWPKGYTPERLTEVAENMPEVYLHSDTLENPENASEFMPYKRTITQSLARSTVPVEHLKSMKQGDKPLQINMVRKKIGRNLAGLFSADEAIVYMPNDSHPEFTHDTLIHELGHAHEYFEDPSKFENDKKDFKKFKGTRFRSIKAHPAREGEAEGYRLAHRRFTRGQMRRGEAEYSIGGYTPEGFKDPQAGEDFARTRLNVFRREFRG